MNIDLDEIRPDRFVIHNVKLRPLLKGEGVTAGKFFELVTWRREGLLARIRERGFNVRTIADRIAVLPEIGPVAPLGPEGVRLLSQAKERIATFDRTELRWRDLPVIEHAGKAAVRINSGVALRRRKSRGHADYYLATLAHNDLINLLPVTETEALLQAYAQLAQTGPQVIVHYTLQPDALFIPKRHLTLPPPHAETLSLLTRDKAESWTIPTSVRDFAAAVFAKLGIVLQPA